MLPQKDPEHYEKIQNILLLHNVCNIYKTLHKMANFYVYVYLAMDVRFRFHRQMM